MALFPRGQHAALEGDCQMIDEGAHCWWQPSPGRENQVHDALLRVPLRKQPDQSAGVEVGPADMIRKQCHSEACGGGGTKGAEFLTS